MDGGTGEARYVGIGIGEYDEYPELAGARPEVEAVAAYLAGWGVRTDVVDASREADVKDQLSEVMPNRDEVDDDTRRANEHSAILILWAGHGDVPQGGGMRLVCSDTRPARRAEITPEDVIDQAMRTGATQVLVIIDACFAGKGVLPSLSAASNWANDQVDAAEREIWVGVVGSALEWERARDGLFAEHLMRILRDGPQSDDLRLRWSPHNSRIRGDDLMDALNREWPKDAPHRLKVAQSGLAMPFLPNPLYNAAAPAAVAEHLLLAARGGARDDETWYFAGRHGAVGRAVGWVRSGRPGLRVVTGPAGCGKSAVLGLIACLSIAEQRAAFAAQREIDYTEPGVGAVHAQVHARGLARMQLAREIDAQLVAAGILPMQSTSRRGSGELVDAVAASGRIPVIVIDGLDEAGAEAWPIAEELLKPLASHALVIVGTRDLPPVPDGAPLVRRLQPDELGVMHLLDEVDDRADIREYVRRRLAKVDAPQMDRDAIADAISMLEGTEVAGAGNFLLARMVTGHLRLEPVDTSQPGWQDLLSTSVESGLDQDLELLPNLVRDGENIPAAGLDLLTALAWAQGAGCPDDIWPIIAEAVSGARIAYERADGYWAMSVAGRYIVEDGDEGRAVYRLAHQSLALHLRRQSMQRLGDELPLRIATRLVDRYARFLEKGLRPEDYSYLWRYTWRHCADAGTAGLDQLRRLDATSGGAFRLDLALASDLVAIEHHTAGRLDLAVQSAEEAVACYRELWVATGEYTTDLAKSLANLAVLYSQTGRSGDAVVTAERAVTLYDSDLEADNPGATAEHAYALMNLGILLGNDDRSDEAVAPAAQAAALFGRLTVDNPAFRPELATSQGSLAWQYWRSGRREEAVHPAALAVTIFESLAADNQAFRRDLAAALQNLGILNGELGRADQALAAIERGHEIYVALAEREPAFRADVAKALHYLGIYASEAGSLAEAISWAEEAVGLRREIALADPMAARELAESLISLAERYDEGGRLDDAVRMAQEAADTYGQVSPNDPAVRLNEAAALNLLGLYYAAAGRHDESIAPAVEAVARYQALVEDDASLEGDLADALDSLGVLYGAADRPREAIGPIQRAIDLYASLAIEDPALRRAWAEALGNLSYYASETDRPADAIDPAERAVELWTSLAEENPTLVAELAASLEQLGGCYAEVGRVNDATARYEQAARIRESIGESAVGETPARKESDDPISYL